MRRRAATVAAMCLPLVGAGTAAAQSGEIQVTCPAELQVLLDGSPVRVASTAERGLRLVGVPAGWHVVGVAREGQPALQRELHLSAGGSVELSFSANPDAVGGPLRTPVLANVPDVTVASPCFYPRVPRPTEPAEVIRARLEAAGRWRPGPGPGRTPPANPQVGDTWDW